MKAEVFRGTSAMHIMNDNRSKYFEVNYLWFSSFEELKVTYDWNANYGQCNSMLACTTLGRILTRTSTIG